MGITGRIALASTALAGAAATALFAVAPAAQAGTGGSFIGKFSKLSTIGSTVPANGDVNPYGTVLVTRNQGTLVKGNVLISNFNNSKNLQGTGTTIVQVSPKGKLSVFAQINAAKLPGKCPGGVGLTTALTVLSGGWVVVGSLPTKDGSAATSSAGCLIVLDNHGRVRETFAGNGINGPWDMTSVSRGPFAELFVTNVLKGTKAAGGSVVNNGTVLRLVLLVGGSRPPRLINTTTIGSGFPQRTDPAALVIGATGVGLAPSGTLYVANGVDSAINAIPGATWRSSSAGTGTTITKGGALNTPLGLIIAPNGDVLTVNGGNGLIVETTPSGNQVAKKMLDSSGSPPGAGALFGLALAPHNAGVYYVDDAVNTLRLLH
ncbi:MAG TPA: hypothetical protein VFJ07_11475 [Streptosporangiaceae bacterium]|nr:hypothetical protein [Streptosporangiaceae bacterium]